jgi:hypothetical protein
MGRAFCLFGVFNYLLAVSRWGNRTKVIEVLRSSMEERAMRPPFANKYSVSGFIFSSVGFTITRFFLELGHSQRAILI